MVLNGQAVDTLSAAIGAIYETALDARAWPEALAGIQALIGAPAVWIATHYPDQIRSIYPIEAGTDPEQQRRLREHYVAASPFIGVTHHVKLGDVVAVGDVIDYDEFLAGKFYREWAGPQGWPDFIMAVAAKDRECFSWLGVCCTARATVQQKALVALLLPHVERALRISRLLEARETQSADLLAAVESMASGMVLVDGTLGVRGINAAARTIIAGLEGMAVVDGHLRLSARGPPAQITAAVTACADGRIERAGASVLIDQGDGPGVLAHVLPLPRESAGRDGAVAAILLTNPSQAGHAPIESFVQRYTLTPSETRVLMAMLEGKSPRAIAAAQGVGLPTVRTHLSRLYDKTGTGGQTELVRLATSLTRTV